MNRLRSLQVATQFTKGLIIWRTVYGHVAVGPTAEPQPSRADRSTSDDTISELLRHGERCVPVSTTHIRAVLPY